MGKTIHVSDEVWAELTRLKVDFKAKTLDEVLRKVLGEWKQLKQ
jgi:predicted CopG family antitoxin